MSNLKKYFGLLGEDKTPKKKTRSGIPRMNEIFMFGEAGIKIGGNFDSIDPGEPDDDDKGDDDEGGEIEFRANVPQGPQGPQGGPPGGMPGMPPGGFGGPPPPPPNPGEGFEDWMQRVTGQRPPPGMFPPGGPQGGMPGMPPGGMGGPMGPGGQGMGGMPPLQQFMMPGGMGDDDDGHKEIDVTPHGSEGGHKSEKDEPTSSKHSSQQDQGPTIGKKSGHESGHESGHSSEQDKASKASKASGGNPFAKGSKLLKDKNSSED